MFEDKEIEDRLAITVPEWRTYTLEIDTDKGTYEIDWNRYVEELAFYSMFQIGLGDNLSFSLQTFYEQHNKKRQEEFNRNYNLGAYDLPDNPNILDIGAGMGITDLILYNYLPDAKLNLLDKSNGWKDLKDKPREFLNGYNEEYIFYNDRKITLHAIECNEYDINRFRFMEPDDEWEQYDLIQSTWSYAWHYPLDTYWDNVLHYLKPGGKLLLDVYNHADINVISRALNCAPDKNYLLVGGNESSDFTRCLWTRK